MATLAVRPLSVRDVFRLRFVRQRQDVVDPDLIPSDALLTQRQMVSVIPLDLSLDRGYAAFIDGELCATALLRPEPEQFRWNVIALSVGSPRLAADDDVYEELWTALLEYGIRGAGESGAKRLFAAARDEGTSYRSLRASGFEPYARRSVVSRSGNVDDISSPAGFRRQEPSDVWSIHQLYHHVTPRSVQAAEALTSSTWELDGDPLWRRMLSMKERVGAYVVETPDGIEAFIRVEARGHNAFVEWMATPDCRTGIVALVQAGVRELLGGSVRTVAVSVPQYAGEVIRLFHDEGFGIGAERVVLVRHTTVPAIVHSKLMPVSVAESGERVPRGVPSYYRCESFCVATINRPHIEPLDRTERSEP